MCGIFGVIKSDNAGISFKEQVLSRSCNQKGQELQTSPTSDQLNQDTDRASVAFRLLGYLAMSRGNDAAGFAAFTGRSSGNSKGYALDSSSPLDTARLATRRYLHLDGWRIYKQSGSFKRLWERLTQLEFADSSSGKYGIEEVLTGAKILVGHTRLATVNRADKSLVHTSPLLAGSLLGTHNGGVGVRDLLTRYNLPQPHGITSSEVIFLALAQATSNFIQPKTKRASSTTKVTSVLTALAGRAALAWVDRTDPTEVYLARTAVSPLAVARDTEGNFYWASRSDWFRLLDERTNGWFGFCEIEELVEGSFLVVRGQPQAAPLITERKAFEPTIRLRDVPFWLKEQETEAEARAEFELEKADEAAAESVQTRVARPLALTTRDYPTHLRILDVNGTSYLTLAQALQKLEKLQTSRV